MDKEFNAFVENGTWENMDFPTDKKTINYKWVFKVKLQSNEEFERYKARLVARLSTGKKCGL